MVISRKVISVKKCINNLHCVDKNAPRLIDSCCQRLSPLASINNLLKGYAIVERTERYYKIDQLIHRHRHLSKATILEALEVSEATFK